MKDLSSLEPAHIGAVEDQYLHRHPDESSPTAELVERSLEAVSERSTPNVDRRSYSRV